MKNIGQEDAFSAEGIFIICEMKFARLKVDLVKQDQNNQFYCDPIFPVSRQLNKETDIFSKARE